MIEAGFCLGSNMGARLRQLSQAKTLMLLDPRVMFRDQSAVYETEPVGVEEKYQTLKFLNAVLIVESPYTAEEWLKKIKTIENTLHRVRTTDRNAPRTIDIDILFCGSEIVDSSLLQVPHSRWAERRFVVQPLAEVRPERVLPGTEMPVRKVLEQLPDNQDVRLFTEKW
jgi:2-amino-4-hydroxy-6-hydroxymethyldihydropteridine diphosphokinase